MTGRDAAQVILVVLLFLTVQQTLMLDIRIGGVHPDIMVLLPIVAGIVGGPCRGAIMGFGAGLVADLFLPTPFGLSALVGCLVGFGVGVATLALDRAAWWLPPLAALGASAAYEVVYAAVGSVLGQPQMLHVDLVGIVVVVSVVNAVLAVPALRLVAWALPRRRPKGCPPRSVPSGVSDDRSERDRSFSQPRRHCPVGTAGYPPVNRSLRHPFSGSKQYLRPERERFGPRKVAKQPRIHKNRFSVEAMLDAPDTTAARPGLRLRITGLVVIALFALLGLRLWTLQVLQAPAAAQAVSANQIRAVAIAPTRGLILDRYRHAAGQQRGHRADHPVPGAGGQRPRGGRAPGRPDRPDARPGPTPPSPTSSTACTSRCRSWPTPPCPTSSTSRSTRPTSPG